MTTPSLAVLISGSGTNLQAVLDAIAAGSLAAEVVVVGADRAGATGLARASAAGVPTFCLPLRDRRDAAERACFERRLGDILAAFSPDLIVLAGWMLVLSPVSLARFAGRVLNVHPALLPGDGGRWVATSQGPRPVYRGAHAVRDVLAAGEPVTGATVHWVTAEPDAGPVVLREEVAIEPGDDEARLHARIKTVEHRLLPRAIGLVLGAETKQGER